MKKRVAIQGIKGSYHHTVSQEYFKDDIDVNECLTFDQLVTSLLNKDSDLAIMAIENSIAGSIIPNYALIDQHHLHIIGEHYLDVQHNLMALHGQSINDISEVHSHPMALLQCKEFFKKYPHIKLVEDKDTADVAKRIQLGQLKGIAAVASKTAAKIYKLNNIAEHIQTIRHNETRFMIVKTSNSVLDPSEINKASIKFELDHSRGSLAAILNVMSDCKLNLTKIQSLPKLNTLWKYAFFVDITFEEYGQYLKAKSIIEIMAEDFKVLGEYKNGRV